MSTAECPSNCLKWDIFYPCLKIWKYRSSYHYNYAVVPLKTVSFSALFCLRIILLSWFKVDPQAFLCSYTNVAIGLYDWSISNDVCLSTLEFNGSYRSVIWSKSWSLIFMAHNCNFHIYHPTSVAQTYICRREFFKCPLLSNYTFIHTHRSILKNSTHFFDDTKCALRRLEIDYSERLNKEL